VYFHRKIYDFGGYNETFQPTNTTRIYDIYTNMWTTGAPMPAALGGMVAGLWKGIVYVAGGSPDIGASVVDTLYAYDIAANSWTTLAPIPQALCVSGVGIIHGKLYVAGGSDGVTPLNTLYIYDIRSNTWTTGANLPAAAEAPGSAVLHNQLYLFGGKPMAALTQIYDPFSNTWSFGPNLDIDRFRFYATAVGNHSIVILGGQNALGTALDDNDQLKARPCHPRP
jgi:N-acetylneuraminic acid mutarotase